ncbi:unnamed protein product [Nippostrongylus brasiliensis]|uniref:Neprilysin-1 (inferred by orthology to a C. elegans protein) n=1 Tax=Nippostrongylus brasiliensis TaxID=27835 RepID=A0A0N4YBL6_NIPBR|nr:unnamed protein product [Nippostrongylus brasiliensis]
MKWFQFSQIDLGLGESTRDYYLDKEHEKKIEAYKKRMISEMRLLHEDAKLTFNETKTADDVDEIVKFETKLAKITVPEEDRRNHTALYNLRHLSDMQQLMPLVNWMEYLHDYAPSEVHDYLASNPEIIIEDINYIKNITGLLKSTEPRIITNYMLLIFAWNWIDEFGDRYEDVHQEFSHVMVGREKKRPRWERCLSSLMEIPKYATGALFVKKFFNKNTKKAMEEMALEMQEVLQEMLSENEWMDENTKKTALDKVSKMLIHVAYPDFILDDKKVDEYYKEISLKETDSFSDMVTKLEKWDSNFSMKRLLKPVDRNEFEMNPSEVNAYYCGECNTMAIPAAQLQAPFFHATFPWSLNYGAMGSLIGHEMFHGFDDEGRQYDSIGNLHDWWSDEALEKFVNRSQCFIDQYGNIKVPGTGLKVNGKMTQGENIADSGGVKQAYKAYKRYLKKHGEEKRAKGLEQISDEQMFFIGYATVQLSSLAKECNKIGKPAVNQVLANQPEFAAAFKCAVGTPMYPKERCAVW